MNQEQLLQYLRANASKLNLAGIAAAAGVAPRTLRQYVEGTRGETRGIPDETCRNLALALKSLRW